MNYLSIKEIVSKTGRAEITIRRWVKELLDTNPEAVKKKFVSESPNSPFSYEVDENLVMLEYSKDILTNQMTTQATTQKENDDTHFEVVDERKSENDNTQNGNDEYSNDKRVPYHALSNGEMITLDPTERYIRHLEKENDDKREQISQLSGQNAFLVRENSKLSNLLALEVPKDQRGKRELWRPNIDPSQPFNQKEELKLIFDTAPEKKYKILMRYFSDKGFNFTNREQLWREMENNMEHAEKLADYEGEQIIKAFRFANNDPFWRSQAGGAGWTLKNVAEHIGEWLAS